MAKGNGVKAIDPATNDAETIIQYDEPYTVEFILEGIVPLLFHKWSCESVDAKSKAAKNSKAKKTDDIESYVYRNSSEEVCLPGEYVRQAMVYAAKFRQDPRSPRKSAMDLFKAGIATLTELAPLGKQWDYVDQRRVTIQRQGITRMRPAMFAGWKGKFIFQVMLPEYIEQSTFNEVLAQAGRIIGVGDFRPTYGRFQVNKFEVLKP